MEGDPDVLLAVALAKSEVLVLADEVDQPHSWYSAFADPSGSDRVSLVCSCWRQCGQR